MNEQDLKQWTFTRLKHALQALAASASEQARGFPAFVHKTGELLLNFDQWHLCVLNYRDELTAEQITTLQALDTHIARAAGNTSLYSDAALQSHPFWQHARELAADCLRAFRWEQENPPNYVHEYVRG